MLVAVRATLMHDSVRSSDVCRHYTDLMKNLPVIYEYDMLRVCGCSGADTHKQEVIEVTEVVFLNYLL